MRLALVCAALVIIGPRRASGLPRVRMWRLAQAASPNGAALVGSQPADMRGELSLPPKDLWSELDEDKAAAEANATSRGPLFGKICVLDGMTATVDRVRAVLAIGRPAGMLFVLPEDADEQVAARWRDIEAALHVPPGPKVAVGFTRDRQAVEDAAGRLPDGEGGLALTLEEVDGAPAAAAGLDLPTLAMTLTGRHLGGAPCPVLFVVAHTDVLSTARGFPGGDTARTSDPVAVLSRVAAALAPLYAPGARDGPALSVVLLVSSGAAVGYAPAAAWRADALLRASRRRAACQAAQHAAPCLLPADGALEGPVAGVIALGAVGRGDGLAVLTGLAAGPAPQLVLRAVAAVRAAGVAVEERWAPVNASAAHRPSWPHERFARAGIPAVTVLAAARVVGGGAALPPGSAAVDAAGRDMTSFEGGRARGAAGGDGGEGGADIDGEEEDGVKETEEEGEEGSGAKSPGGLLGPLLGGRGKDRRPAWAGLAGPRGERLPGAQAPPLSRTVSAPPSRAVAAATCDGIVPGPGSAAGHAAAMDTAARQVAALVAAAVAGSGDGEAWNAEAAEQAAASAVALSGAVGKALAARRGPGSAAAALAASYWFSRHARDTAELWNAVTVTDGPGDPAPGAGTEAALGAGAAALGLKPLAVARRGSASGEAAPGSAAEADALASAVEGGLLGWWTGGAPAAMAWLRRPGAKASAWAVGAAPPPLRHPVLRRAALALVRACEAAAAGQADAAGGPETARGRCSVEASSFSVRCGVDVPTLFRSGPPGGVPDGAPASLRAEPPLWVVPVLPILAGAVVLALHAVVADAGAALEGAGLGAVWRAVVAGAKQEGARAEHGARGAVKAAPSRGGRRKKR